MPDDEAERVQAVLDAHYEQHPEVKPSLGDLAVAAAEIDGHPLAAHPDVLRQAAEQILEQQPDADADDVLGWVDSRGW